MTTWKDAARMPVIVTAICLVGGALLALAGLIAALILASGTFHGGREGVFAAAVFMTNSRVTKWFLIVRMRCD